MKYTDGTLTNTQSFFFFFAPFFVRALVVVKVTGCNFVIMTLLAGADWNKMT